MPRYIIPQPNGKYAVFSTITDTYITEELTLDEIRTFSIQEAVEQAIEQATNNHIRTIEKLEKDGPYMTYEEANEMHKENSQ